MAWKCSREVHVLETQFRIHMLMVFWEEAKGRWLRMYEEVENRGWGPGTRLQPSHCGHLKWLTSLQTPPSHVSRKSKENTTNQHARGQRWKPCFGDGRLPPRSNRSNSQSSVCRVGSSCYGEWVTNGSTDHFCRWGPDKFSSKLGISTCSFSQHWKNISKVSRNMENHHLWYSLLIFFKYESYFLISGSSWIIPLYLKLTACSFALRDSIETNNKRLN